MENNELYTTLKKLVDNQIEVAKRYEVISKGTKDVEPTYAWKGKYDPWLLEPRHIALQMEMSLSRVEQVILDAEDPATTDLWNDYKLFQREVMMYDEAFSQIRPQLAEFVLKKFNKDETTSTDAIVKFDNNDTIDLKVEISRLQKELEYYKKGGK